MSKRYNIRWQQDDNEQLKKTVRNYNAKIDRLAKKNPAMAASLPEKTSVKELKELIDTRQDLKREINSLRRFSARGAEEIVPLPIKNTYNLTITKWQKEEMSRRAGIINRRRKKRLDEIQDIEVVSAGQKMGYTRGQLGMGKADEAKLLPINSFTPGMNRTDLKEKYKNLLKESQSSYFNKKDIMLKKNYIDALMENYNPEDVKEIVKAIDNMDFKQFYKIFMASDDHFEIASFRGDRTQYDSYLEGLKSSWLPKKKIKNKGD